MAWDECRIIGGLLLCVCEHGWTALPRGFTRWLSCSPRLMWSGYGRPTLTASLPAGHEGATGHEGTRCVVTVTVVLAALTAACGGSGSSPSPAAAATPTVTNLTIAGNDAIRTTFFATYEATATLSNGTTQVVTATAQWTSSNPPVASVDGTTAGRLNALESRRHHAHGQLPRAHGAEERVEREQLRRHLERQLSDDQMR